MKKSSIIVAVLVLLGVGGAVAVTQLNRNDGAADMSNMTGMQGSADAKSGMESGEEDLTAQKEVAMDIGDFDFEKSNIKIKVGTTVTWTNQDTARHNVVTSGDGSAKLASELLAKGESYSYTFTTAGMTEYLCEPHPYMKGMIHVVE